MEEKLFIEEDTRRSLLRNGSNIALVEAATGRSRDYIESVRTKMANEYKLSPEDGSFVARNIYMEVRKGFEERKQILWDMLLVATKREILLVCVHCDTEIMDKNGTPIDQAFCPKCDKIVYRKLSEQKEIFQLKLSILRQLAGEYKALTEGLYDLNLVEKTKTPSKKVIEAKIESPLVMFTTGAERKLVEGYSNLKPLDRELLIQGLRKDIANLREAIRLEEEENKRKKKEEEDKSK